MAESEQKIFNIPLVRELTVVLVIKLLVVFLIKWSFFSDPIDMQDGSNVMTQHFGVENVPESPPLSPQESK
jgi:hypothetical protein